MGPLWGRTDRWSWQVLVGHSIKAPWEPNSTSESLSGVQGTLLGCHRLVFCQERDDSSWESVGWKETTQGGQHTTPQGCCHPQAEGLMVRRHCQKLEGESPVERVA